MLTFTHVINFCAPLPPQIFFPPCWLASSLSDRESLLCGWLFTLPAIGTQCKQASTLSECTSMAKLSTPKIIVIGKNRIILCTHKHALQLPLRPSQTGCRAVLQLLASSAKLLQLIKRIDS